MAAPRPPTPIVAALSPSYLLARAMSFPLMLLYIAIGGGGALYFQFGRDGAAKRRFFPIYMALCATIFVAVAVFGDFGGRAGPRPWFLIPLVALGTLVNIGLTTFCPRCARMIRRGPFGMRAVACPRCGASLVATDEPPAATMASRGARSGADASSPSFVSSTDAPRRPAFVRALLGWRGAVVLVALLVAAVQMAGRRGWRWPDVVPSGDHSTERSAADETRAIGATAHAALAIPAMLASATTLIETAVADSGAVRLTGGDGRTRITVETPRGTFDIDVDAARFATWAAGVGGDSSSAARDWLRGTNDVGDSTVAFEAVRIAASDGDGTVASTSSPTAYVVEATNGAWEGAVRMSPALVRRIEASWERATAAAAAGVPSRHASPPPPGPRTMVVAPNETGAALEFQVDRPVTVAAEPPMPRYPPALRDAGVEGDVLLSFVVDTTGRARMSTVRVLRYSHPALARAAYDVLPGYQFIPASRAGKKLAQLVQLPFQFSLAR